MPGSQKMFHIQKDRILTCRSGIPHMQKPRTLRTQYGDMPERRRGYPDGRGRTRGMRERSAPHG